MKTRDLIAALAAAHTAQTRLSTFVADAKQRLKNEMNPGDRLSACLEDGTDIGTVSMTKGRDGRPYVADRDAFMRWVEENHPGEIVHSVRPSFETYVLVTATHTGEFPPGVEPASFIAPYVQVRQSEQQEANVVEAWNDGRLQLDGWANPKQLAGSDD